MLPPEFSELNSGYNTLANSEPLGDFGLGSFASEGANLSSIGFVDLGPSVLDTTSPEVFSGILSEADCVGVPMVVGTGDPLQVRNTVSGLATVDMVNLGQIVGVRDEGICNEPVNHILPFRSAVLERNSFVPTLDSGWLEGLSNSSATSWHSSLNITAVTDHVGPTGDRFPSNGISHMNIVPNGDNYVNGEVR